VFDIGFSELILFGAIALIVLGPEKLPHAARMAGAWYGRIKRTISNVQNEIAQEVNALEVRQRMEAELEKIKKAEADLRSEINRINAGIVDLSQGSTQVARPAHPDEVYYYRLMGDERLRRQPPAPYLSLDARTPTPA
jgi:sec-independent protein translocase protein TatB